MKTTKPVGVQLAISDIEILSGYAKRTHRTISAVIRMAILEFLAKHRDDML